MSLIWHNASLAQTKNPILLVHGLALQNQVFGTPYFNRIPASLEASGFEVFDANHLAWGTFEQNADILYNDIMYLTEELGFAKVNIIAHSKGGLDSRFMLWKYRDEGIADRVASITTINSPHHGSVTADSVFGIVPPFLQWVPVLITNMVAWLQGEWDTDSLAVYSSLRSEDMAFLNSIIGMPNQGCAITYCQSWGSVINEPVADRVSQTLSRLNRVLGKDANDGLVSGKSSKFGNFRGLVKPDKGESLSHLAVIDRGLIIREGGTPGFDATEFYLEIAEELASFGF